MISLYIAEEGLNIAMIIELLMKTGFDEMEISVPCQLGTFRTRDMGNMMDAFSCVSNY